MKLSPFPFQTVDWANVPKERHAGDSGFALWQVFMMNDIRIRLVEYSANYRADHWCKKGHVLFCMEGAMTTTLEDGRSFELTAGMSYQVGDDCEAHRSETLNGCKLFIVD